MEDSFIEQPLAAGIADSLRRGDSKAIESVVNDLHAPIYRYLVYQGSSASQAEELTAETFFQVLKSISSFRGDDGQIRAYVFSIARNVRANWYRSRSPEARTIDSATTIADSQDSPMQQLLAQECASDLTKAIEQLSEVAREIIVLRFHEGLSISEIATACEMPIGTVKSHLHRAKQELKQKLSDSEQLK